MPKKLLLLLALFFTLQAASQDDRRVILGKVIADSISIKNAHIFNLTSRKGTISNAYGEFRMPVKVNDTLLISDIQYIPQKIVINETHLKKVQLVITLKLNVNELNEVELKNHNLTGRLVQDGKEAPLIDMPLDMSSLNIDMRVVDNFDQMDKEKAPDSRKLTDPTEQATQGNILGLLNGLGLKTLLKEASKIGQKKRLKKRQQKAYDKKAMRAPEAIRSELGDSFFINDLQIPPENIDNFIKYCASKGIIKLYLNNHKIEAIDILVKQSTYYLKELKDER